MTRPHLLVQTTTASLRQVLATPGSVTWTDVPAVLMSEGVRFDRGRQGESVTADAGRADFTCDGEPLARGAVVRIGRPSAGPMWTGMVTEVSRRWQGGLRHVTRYTCTDVAAPLARTRIESLPIAELLAPAGVTTGIVFDQLPGRLAGGSYVPEFTDSYTGVPDTSAQVRISDGAADFSDNTAEGGRALVAYRTPVMSVPADGVCWSLLITPAWAEHEQTVMSWQPSRETGKIWDVGITSDGYPVMVTAAGARHVGSVPIPHGRTSVMQIIDTTTDGYLVVDGQISATVPFTQFFGTQGASWRALALGASFRSLTPYVGLVHALVEHQLTPGWQSHADILMAAARAGQCLELPEPSDARCRRVLELTGYASRGVTVGTLTGAALTPATWTKIGTWVGNTATLSGAGQSAGLASAAIEVGDRFFDVEITATVTTAMRGRVTVTTAATAAEVVDAGAAREVRHYPFAASGAQTQRMRLSSMNAQHPWAQITVTWMWSTAGSHTVTPTGGGVHVHHHNQVRLRPGMTPDGTAADVINDAARAEMMPARVGPDGRITIPGQTSRANIAAPLTLPASAVSPTTALDTSDRYLANRIVADDGAGYGYVAEDSAAIDAYGMYEVRMLVPAASPADVQAAADGYLARALAQTVDAPDVQVNVTAVAATVATSDLLDADLGTLLLLTQLPAGAPKADPGDPGPAYLRLFVEGVSDEVTAATWTRVFNTSIAPLSTAAWVLGTDTLGTGTRLGGS